MCGLFGFFTTEGVSGYKQRGEWLHTTALVSSLRGTDSTGFGMIPKDLSRDPCCIIKSVVPSYQLLETQRWGRLLSNLDRIKVMIGHTRAATRGKIDFESAHPFEEGHIMLAHNGTLRSYADLEGDVGDTDSRRIAKHLEKHGWEKTLPELHGAYALTWYDSVANSLNICRNDERTLWTGFSDNDKTLFWASEGWMISVLANRAGIKLKSVKMMDIGNLFSWELSNQTVVEPAVSKFKIYELPKVEPLNTYKEYTYFKQPKSLPPAIAETPLGRLELEVGEEVEFVCWDYVPYNQSTLNSSGKKKPTGMLRGMLVPANEMQECFGPEVAVHNVLKSKWAHWTKNDGVDLIRFTGKVLGAKEIYKDYFVVNIGRHKPTKDYGTHGYVVEFHPDKENDFLPFLDTTNETPILLPQYVEKYKGPRGKMLNEKDFKRAVSCGCERCFKSIPVTQCHNQPTEVFWSIHDKPVCAECNKAATKRWFQIRVM